MIQKQVNTTPLHADNVLIQLIVFRCGDEEFGVPIEQVREIIKIGVVTPIPNTPNFLKGIINVRGEIVTTVDIKSRFNLKDGNELNPKHIVVTKQQDGLFGLIVDEVIEVLRIQRMEIKEPPTLLSKINKKYLNGVVSHEKRLIILLDIAQLLTQKELLTFDSKNKNDKASNKHQKNMQSNSLSSKKK